MARHEFSHFMEDLHQRLESDHAVAQRLAREDPGTAGDQAEETWAELLRNWLPSRYPVVTKGRALNELGNTSPQLDILVLDPDYPHGLRTKKLYFSGGILAAFECKLTVRRKAIVDFFRHSRNFKSLYEIKRGTPYHELVHGPYFGLLAHSHSWKRGPSDAATRVFDAIESCLEEFDHPRLLPDAICVADVAAFVADIQVYIGERLGGDAVDLFDETDGKGGVATAYYRFGDCQENRYSRGEVLAAFLTHVWYRLAFEDSGLRWLADHLLQIPTVSTGLGFPYPWPSRVLSDEVINQLLTSGFENHRWSAWSGTY